MCGNGGADEIHGKGGGDKINGGGGNDRLFGDGGNDRLLGKRNDDYIDGGNKDDVANGGGGIDDCTAEEEKKCEDGTAGTTTTTTTSTTPSNQPPALGGISGVLSYTPGDGTEIIASTATVEDVDSPEFLGGTLTVSLTGDDAGDVLTIVNTGTISVAGGSLKVGSTTVGVWDYKAGSRTLSATFNSAATPSVVQEVARAVAFLNASGTPTTGERTAQFVLTDDDGGTSDAATKTIDVSAP